MKKDLLLRFAFILFFLKGVGSFAQGDYFQLYVINDSKFEIISDGMPNTNGGIFSKYTNSLKPGQEFLFGIEQLKGGLPKGVEGDFVFRLNIPKVSGFAKVHFNHPLVGNSELLISDNYINWPFTVEQISTSKIKGLHNTYDCYAIRITVDTTGLASQKTTPLTVGTVGSKPKGGAVGSDPTRLDDALPAVVNFEWRVTQRMRRDDDDDDNKSKAYKEVTYYFTADGEYAASKADDASFSLMVYAKNGQTWIINDEKKRIIVLSMPKTVGEGGMFGKAVAESIAKRPLTKDSEDEGMPPLVKSGKTRTILGYTADEYLMTPKQNSTRNMKASASFWFAKVPFDPVKIYTMGVGRPADVSTIANNPKFKDSYFAIPILNKNYLQIEAEAGGLKGMETTEIAHSFHTIYTAGYKVKVAHNMIEAMKFEHED